MNRGLRAVCIGACLGTCLGVLPARAQQRPPVDAADYSKRPIRLVVPSAPGGGTDTVARLIGQGLTESWDQTLVVDNRGGAGGIPAVTLVAKGSAADGYTALLGSNGHISFAPAIYHKLAFNPRTDLAFSAQIRSEIPKWLKVAREANINVD